MTKLLEKFHLAFAVGFVLALLAAFGLHSGLAAAAGHQFGIGIMSWLHVLSGILWIGLLYYFNIVQIPTMPKIPAELKPGITKHIAPEALFWFRWAALATVVTGLLLAWMKGYVVDALSFGPDHQTIGIGMWLALIMAFNVWFIIWPNQKKALGMVDADDATKQKAARIAMLTSRTNFVLSLPMLYCMVSMGLLG